MAAKFILIIYLTSSMTDNEVGQYGLFQSLLLLSVTLFGMELYTYFLRELHKSDNVKGLLSDWFQITVFVYLVLIIPIYFLFSYSGINPEYLMYFIALIVLEHIGQELTRFLINASQQLEAAWVLFFRTGLWVYVFISLDIVIGGELSVNHLFLFWFCGSILAIIFAFKRLGYPVGLIQKRLIKLNTLRQSLKTGLKFLAGAAILKFIFFIDKLIIGSFNSDTDLAAYILILTVVWGAFATLEPAIFSFSYPKLLKYSSIDLRSEFQSEVKFLTISTLISASLIGFLVYILLKFLITFHLDKYSSQFEDISFIIIFAGLLFIISYVPHYICYSLGLDKKILISNLIMLFTFSIVVLFFSAYFQDQMLLGVSIALLASNFISFLFKSYYAAYAFSKL